MMGRFVADVGGTNIRLAQETNGRISHIKKYLCKDYATIQEVILAYFAEFPDVTFKAGCIGIACPTNTDTIKMTNHHWAFSVKALTQGLSLDWLQVINDYTAVSMSLPVLGEDQKHQIGSGTADPTGHIAVFGPGTGLGVGHLIHTPVGWQSIPGEGGHVDFAPVDAIDMAILTFLQKRYERVSAEQLLSGNGLLQIYQAIADMNGVAVSCEEPAQVTENALSGACEICVKALNQFCAIMGSFAGNLALNMGTSGGIYIAGGIVSRFIPFLEQSDFRARYLAKGRFKEYVSVIPTYVITEPDHGLLGAAAYLEQHYKG
nr:glucokinase [Alteromonas sp. a30]